MSFGWYEDRIHEKSWLANHRSHVSHDLPPLTLKLTLEKCLRRIDGSKITREVELNSPSAPARDGEDHLVDVDARRAR